jgi:hypothetical protein
LEQKRIERFKNTQEADNKNTIEEIESSLELFDAQKDSVKANLKFFRIQTTFILKNFKDIFQIFIKISF